MAVKNGRQKLLPKIAVKNAIKNCQNYQKIVKMLVRSCFLITVIRCLKGQGLLGGSLMSKNKRWLSESVTQSLSQSVTRSPIELSGDS